MGPEGEWWFSGKSLIADPLGKIVAKASESEEEVLVVEVDRQAVIRARQQFRLFRDRRPDAYGEITRPQEELL